VFFLLLRTVRSGIAKEFVVPGWRVGWLVLQDKGSGKLAEVGKGIKNLSQIVLGACVCLRLCVYVVYVHIPYFTFP